MGKPYTEIEWDEMMKPSEENNRYGNVSWILSKGLSVAKMILVTGFAISSAPVILPPLMIISATGFACSLPYGFLLASYAFTGQLMTKLLPVPSHLSLEYYGTNKNIIVDAYRDEEACSDQFGGDIIDMGKEEEPILSLEVNSINEISRGEMIFDEENEYEVRQGFWKDEKNPLDDKNKATHVEENGYEEDVEDQDRKPPSQAQQVEQEKTVIEQDDEAIDGASQVMIATNEGDIEGRSSDILKEEETRYELARSLAVKLSQDHEKEEDKERAIRETTGIVIEKIRDEGKVDLEALHEENKKIVENVYGDVEEEIGHGNAQETSRNGNGSAEEHTRVIGQDVEENGNKTSSLRSEEVKEMVSAVLMEKQPIQDVGELFEKKDVDDSTKGRAQGNVAYVKQNLQPIREKELVVSPANEDAREFVDESGLDLFDGTKAVGLQCSYADYRIPEGSEQSSYKAYEVTVPTTVDDSKCTGITSGNDIHMAAGNGKVLCSEDKIWKQIHAISTIVGYKASVRGTCMEELKALYVFTGVEPPASFRNPSDLAEVNDKLIFLMTVVGVM